MDGTGGWSVEGYGMDGTRGSGPGRGGPWGGSVAGPGDGMDGTRVQSVV